MKTVRNRRRVVWLFVVHAVAMILCLAWLAASPRADAPQELNSAAETIRVDDAPWIGVGGCAAAACHGGEVDKPRGEYTTWITRDPHSRAYSVLFGEPALQMARRLAGGDATRSAAPHEDRRCLECHAPTGPLTDRTPQLVGDGVGCEACHGAAERWSTEHATIPWKELSQVEQSAKRRELGMTDMRDVLTRARQCTPCHVGDADADVNHDLIAAGHPRMSFELGAFHEELPKHWPSFAERRRDRSFEAKLWAVGQATSAAANLELLAARTEPGHGIEFSNYDCYACHHELRAPSLRPSGGTSVSRPGELRPETWYESALLTWGERAIDALPAPPARIVDLARSNQLRTPENARAAAQELRGWAVRLNDSTAWQLPTVSDLEAAVSTLPPASPTWDQAVQWYLGMVALERSRLDYYAPWTESDRELQSQLQAMKAMLDFPATSGGAQLNSPRDFDPQAFRTAAERLKKIIAARPQPAGGGGAP